MKKKVFILVELLLFLSIGLYAQVEWSDGLGTGNELIQKWDGTKKLLNNIKMTSIDFIDDAYFQGFVLATVEGLTMNGIIDFPAGAARSQFYRVVGLYLETHPESLHENAYILTIRALKLAFPKKK